MDTTGIIIFSIIMLHLLAGFGFLFYKLSSRKGEGANVKGENIPAGKQGE